ncbi:MAG: MTH1187 family thiamine-binding protein [bacterium]
MPVAEISIIPIGTGSTSLSDFVAEAVKVIFKSGLKYELTAMGTNVEGTLAEILSLTQEVHQAALRMGAQRVLTTVKIDDRKDKELTLKGKVEAVRKKIA